MAEQTKKDGGINGVLVLGGGVNAEHWMESTKAKYEAPDRYGKSNKVEFDITDEYIGYQVV